MYKRICVTNRHLVKGDFIEQIRHLLSLKDGPDSFVIREKDLNEEDYEKLLVKLKELDFNNKKLLANKYVEAAKRQGITGIHLPYNDFSQLKNLDILRRDFKLIGTSCHSLEDAIKAKEKGVDYIFVGHIFETDCKKGLRGRGLGFLEEITRAVPIPVYAIGGINEDNAMACIKAGAKGVCEMSNFMKK